MYFVVAILYKFCIIVRVCSLEKSQGAVYSRLTWLDSVNGSPTGKWAAWGLIMNACLGSHCTVHCSLANKLLFWFIPSSLRSSWNKSCNEVFSCGMYRSWLTWVIAGRVLAEHAPATLASEMLTAPWCCGYCSTCQPLQVFAGQVCTPEGSPYHRPVDWLC